MVMSAESYKRQLLALLPPGAAWPRDRDSLLVKLLGGLAEELARIDARASDLIRESDPRSTYELLADWERVAGLPDKCSRGRATTIEERRAALVAKLTMRGGSTKAYFIALAKQLGYDITIDEFRPFICGISRCGDVLTGGHSVRHVWRVNVPGARYTPFRTGVSQCGDKLGKITRAEDLACKLNTLKPAHTRIIFNYTGV